MDGRTLLAYALIGLIVLVVAAAIVYGTRERRAEARRWRRRTKNGRR